MAQTEWHVAAIRVCNAEVEVCTSALCENRGNMAQEFYVGVERDEDGLYIGEVPQLQGCYSQGQTLDELMQNMKEAIALCLEELTTFDVFPEFVGVQKVLV